jgi:hypothetical protein
MVEAPRALAAPSVEEFGEIGSGAGQFFEATAIAISQTEPNDLYLVDRQNNRVDEFRGDGHFIRAWGWGVADGETQASQICEATCFPGIPGAGEGQFTTPLGTDTIAVSSLGDVYVLDDANNRIERFNSEGHFELEFSVTGASVAVGPTGTVYVGEENAVHEYTREGESVATVALEGAGVVTGLEVDSVGDIFTVGDQQVHEYDPTGVLLQAFELEPGLQAEALTLGPGGDVFVEATNGSFERQFRLVVFDSAARTVAVYDAGVVSGLSVSEARGGIAFGEEANALYIPINRDEAPQPATESVRLVAPPRPGPLVERPVAEEVGSISAVIHALIDPETSEESNEAHYRVDYGTSSAYGSSAPISEGALVGSFAETEVAIPIEGLQPHTTYHFRVVASDECEPEKGVQEAKCVTMTGDQTFTTLPPVLIESESAVDVTSTSAKLRAEVNPLHSDTSVHFAYGPTTACGGSECSLPASDIDIGAGNAVVEVPEQELQGLEPGTSYHYHLVARNAVGLVEGPERTFATRVGGEPGLADGRAWEMVSPEDKHGAGIRNTDEYDFFEAAANGDAFEWPATTATESAPQGNTEAMQVLSTRSSEGWSSLDLEVPHTEATGAPGTMEYPFFSEDLGRGILDPFGGFEPGLSPEASEQTPYVRDNFIAGDSRHVCFEGCFTPLVTGCPAEGEPCSAAISEHADVPPGTVFGPEPNGECAGQRCDPEFIAATPDARHVVIKSHVPLSEVQTQEEGLYEWADGHLSLISLLPRDEEGKEEPALRPALGYEDKVTVHAISTDGSRVFWEETERDAEKGLYVRDVSRHETLRISSGPFEATSADGTKVFSNGQECDLSVNESTEELECASAGAPYGRLLAISEDGSWVYAENEGMISVRHLGVTKPVATNVGGLRAIESGGITGLVNFHWKASRNGQWFAFMSNSPLTGYDNRDAVSRASDEEVFLYDAAHERLTCVSCLATGGRPHGVDSGPAVIGWPPNETWIAASLPGWTPYTRGFSLYQSRYLDDSGRLFFDSTDALVPKDVNGQQDVYEFEPLGVPAGAHPCTKSSTSGSVVLDTSRSGCVALLSSGESADESSFLDASESGSDVFFLSTGSVPPLKTDGSFSVFDAHECTAGSPCIPPPSGAPGGCESEASCKPPLTQPATGGGPSGSAAFSGPGNLRTTIVVPRVQTRAEKVSRALKRCRKHRSRKRRRACEAGVRKRLGIAMKTGHKPRRKGK